MRIILFLIGLLSAAFYSTGFGQYTVRYFDENDGLKQPQITSDVWETDDGYIWFFNAGQLCRFDGATFDYYADTAMHRGYYDNNVSSQTYEVAGGFLVPGIGDYVFFKNGQFQHLPDLNSDLSGELKGGMYGTFKSLSKCGQSYYHDKVNKNSILFQIQPSGGIKIDTIRTVVDANGNTAPLFLSNTGEYSCVSNSVLYRISKSGEVISQKVDVPNLSLWGDYPRLVDFLDDGSMLAYDYADTSFFHLDSDGKLRSSPSRKAYHMLSGIEFDVSTGLGFSWVNGNDFSFFCAGDFINNDTAYYWWDWKKFSELALLSKNEMLLSSGDYLIIRNFESGKMQVIDGLSGVQGNDVCVLKDGKIFVETNSGFYLLTKKSSIEVEETYKLAEIESGANEVDMGFVAENGLCYGEYYDLDENEANSRFSMIAWRDGFFTVKDGVYKEEKGEVKVIDQLGPSKKESFKAKTILQHFDPEQKHIALMTLELEHEEGKTIVIKGNEDICKPYSYAKFFWFKTDLYCIGKSGTTYRLNESSRSFEPATEFEHQMKTPKILGDYLYNINYGDFVYGTADSRIRGDTCTISWININAPSKRMEATFLSKGQFYERPTFYTAKQNKIFVFATNESITFNELDLETGEFRSKEIDPVLMQHLNEGMGTVDAEGNLWMAHEEGLCLFRNSSDQEPQLIRLSDLDQSMFVCMQFDGQGRLIVLTDEAMYSFEAANYLAGQDFQLIRVMDSPDYVQNIRVLESGEILLDNWSGFVKIPANYIEALKPQPPVIQLKSLKNGEKYLFGEYPEFTICDPAELPSNFDYANNNLSFEFTALEFRNHKHLKFRHKLSGIYDDWDYTTNPIIKLKDLQPGSYTFEVQSIYQEVPSASFTYQFTILPPWYETWWARVLYVLIVLVLIVLIVRQRTARLIKRQLELEQTVEERTEEVVEQKKEAENQRDLAHEQKQLVEEKNREIVDSMTYAKRLQSAILPPPRLVKEWLNDSFIFYKPKDIVAGDFYWMEVTKRKGRNVIFFAAADCTGHGVPGAMVSVVCSTALNRAINEFHITEPGPLLDQVTELVTEAFSKSEDEVKDGMDIAICAVDLIEQKLWFSGANNSLYRITDIGVKVNEVVKTVEFGGRKLVEYKADRQPVGAYDQMTAFTTTEIQLEPEDCLYIFSDGFADQFGGEKGKKFKYSNFKKLLLEIEGEEMDQQKEVLDQKFEEWRGSMEQIDDVCIIGLRVNGHLRKIFSQRELEIIELLKKGLSSNEIAETLFIAKSTVDTHRKRILAKTNLKNVAELISFVAENEIL